MTPDPAVIAFLLLSAIWSLRHEMQVIKNQRASEILTIIAVTLIWPTCVYVWTAIYHTPVQELSPWARWGYAFMGLSITLKCIWDYALRSVFVFALSHLRGWINRHG